MRKTDVRIRLAVYDYLCIGTPQKTIVSLLKKAGYHVDPARVSRLTKEFIENGFIHLQVKTKPNIYIPTRRKYPPCQSVKRGGYFTHCHGRAEIEVAREGEVRLHNQVLVFTVARSSPVFDGDAKSWHWDRSWFRWDYIARTKSWTRFLYRAADGTVLIRFHGRWGGDTLEILIPDAIWLQSEFDNYEDWFEEKKKKWEADLERFFGIDLEFRKANKPHYAIAPLTPEMARTFVKTNVTVGDVHGDASHGVPELEITDFQKAVEMMKMLDRIGGAAVEDRKRRKDGSVAYS